VLLCAAILTLTPALAWSQSSRWSDPFATAAPQSPAASDLTATLPPYSRRLSAASQTGGTAAPAEQAAQPSTPAVTAGWHDGFVIQSDTGEYRLQVGVLLHADGRFALDDENEAVVSTFALRRVRPSLRGRLTRHFEFYLNPDFANGNVVVQDAYLDTRLSPALVIRLGKAKTPFGLERLIAVSSLPFFERALPSALMPNRDVGVQVLGDLPGGFFSYAVGVLNGVPDGASGDLDTNDGKDLAGRVAVRPFGAKPDRALGGLTVAVAGTTGDQFGPLGTVRTQALQQTFVSYAGAAADGRLSRYSPQASYYFKRASALAEYVRTRVPVRRGSIRREVTHSAWQVAGLLVLTGGDVVSERGVRPRHNFDPGAGHFGALQVGARYHALSLDDEAVALGLASLGTSREAKAWTVGVNWYLNPHLKYVVNFERIEFDGNAVAARRPENALAFRAQVNF
jgi:phosphate-selective porin OprO/OprP